MNVITKDNYKLFTYSNDEICEFPVKGIVLEFHGLGGGNEIIKVHSDFAMLCANKGIIYLIPYYGPWSWMNDIAINTVDEILEAVWDRFSLDESVPIISTGGSMGGLSALIYTRYAKRKVSACAANCPVCDLIFHYTEREDLPRTIYHAFSHYECGFESAIKSGSPVEQVEYMPDIPYFIAHCTNDTAVSKTLHSDVFVKKMLETGKNITYEIVQNRGHCDLDAQGWSRYRNFIFENCR